MILRNKIWNRLKPQNIPILYKIMLAHALVITLIILLSIANFSIFSADKEASTLRTVEQSNIQVLNKIDDYVKDLTNITKFPLTRRLSDSTYLNQLDDYNNTNTSSLEFQQMTDNMFNDIFSYKEQIHSVFLFNRSGLALYKMNGSLYSPRTPVNDEWFVKSVAEFGKPVIVSTFNINDLAEVVEPPANVFAVARGIVNISEAKVVGIILVNTRIDFVKSLYQKLVPSQRVILADASGNTIYDTVETNISRQIDQDLFALAGHESRGTTKIKKEEGPLLVSYSTSDYSGWKIISIIPMNELNKELNEMKKLTVLYTFVIIVIAFALVLLISRHIVAPIRRLVFLMNLIKNGDFDVKIKIESQDEIGLLSKSFNSMTSQIKTLINEVYLDKIRQKELELQMLQNQINPHFLYNTLESISMSALINKDDRTSEMASLLGNILRYGIGQNGDYVTVREEVKYLNDYIQLQKSRFDSYSVVVDVEDAILDQRMIKLVLQPILENAIYHGMVHVKTNGVIKLIGYRKGDNLIFIICDNGRGMEDEQVLALNEYINDRNESFQSIGLKNVNKRIKLHYREEYGLEVYSSKDTGTKVVVTLPAKLTVTNK